jgi:hypothetical protein
MFQKSSARFFSFMLLGLLVAAPATVFADVGKSNSDIGHPQVAQELTDFKRTVFEMRMGAEQLDALTPNRDIHWQSHVYSLDRLKESVNQLGKSLTQLESMKPMASENQQLAIDNARPHLVAAAQNLTQAYALLGEDSRNVYGAEYAGTVSGFYEHADSLYRETDTILDYEKAKLRMDRLELR